LHNFKINILQTGDDNLNLKLEAKTYRYQEQGVKTQ